jgi:hypothetical protein
MAFLGQYSSVWIAGKKNLFGRLKEDKRKPWATGVTPGLPVDASEEGFIGV